MSPQCLMCPPAGLCSPDSLTEGKDMWKERRREKEKERRREERRHNVSEFLSDCGVMPSGEIFASCGGL